MERKEMKEKKWQEQWRNELRNKEKNKGRKEGRKYKFNNGIKVSDGLFITDPLIASVT